MPTRLRETSFYPESRRIMAVACSDSHKLRKNGRGRAERGGSKVGEPSKSNGSAFRGVGMAAALAAQLILAVVLGLLLGRWLDGLLHTTPWLTIIGVVAGIVAGFMGLFHLSKVWSK